MGETHLYRPGRPVVAVLALAILLTVLGLSSDRADGAPLSISISGNHFVNGAGQTIRLLGVNHPSAEYACVDGFGYDDGHLDDADAAAIASWNATAVRIPLNEDCWLGINGQPNNSQDSGETLTAAGYQQAVKDYVSFLNAHGLYAILDLHWSAPGNQVAAEQQPMPDYDHSPAFWQSVASTFKANPAVVFDLFNEPYDPTDPKSGSDQNLGDKVTWNCWDTGTESGPGGGAPCDTSAYDANETKTSPYRVAGLQTLLDTIRGTGAKQPVMAGGLDYANDLSQWADHAPNDPLNQEAASFHNYMGKSCDEIACWNAQIAPVATNVPVVTGEFDEDNFAESKCATKAPSTFDQDYMSWADQNGVSYLAWGWVVLTQEEKDEEGCSAFYLIDDYGGTPAFPNGALLHDHLLTLPAAGVATSATDTTGAGTGTTTTTAGANGATQPPITLKLFKQAVRIGGTSVRFTLSSPESCSGTLSGQTVDTYVATVKHKRRHVSLGTVHFLLKAGKAKAITLTLSRSSRRLLAAKHALSVHITITLTSAGHRRTVVARTLTLKTPPRHARSSH